jgi:N-acetylglucosaminyldiphosphoundecaprenol N-acetyl-beta-D-mannosaminyltransferase
MNIFGVEAGNFSKKHIQKRIDDAILSKERLTIATLNPEMLLYAKKNEYYKNVLNSFDLKSVDGFGIVLVSWLKFGKKTARYPGADLAEDILNKSLKKNLKVTLVNRQGGLSSKEDLKSKFKNFSGINTEEVLAGENYSDFALKKLRKTEILIVGLGVPEQEKFIMEAKKEMPDLKLAIGVGGTLDYWSGKQKRAPVWIRKIGIEWLYRLYRQPRRLGRIFRAVVVFPFEFFRDKRNF